jgi:hypothetical protein
VDHEVRLPRLDHRPETLYASRRLDVGEPTGEGDQAAVRDGYMFDAFSVGVE